jgi:hypothetical protein
MSINFYPSGIETRETNPRMRPAMTDLDARVQAELAAHSAKFIAESEAALKAMNLQREPANEFNFSGPAFIAGASNTPGIRTVLADLFAPSRPNGREMA